MYLLSGARLLLRRWITCLAGLLLVAAACWAVSERVAIDHAATSQMLFILPPDASGAETPTNPYLNLQQGLVTTGGLVASNLSTKDAQRELAADGDTADYTISLVPEAGPLIEIRSTDPDPAIALATRNELMDRVDSALAELQTEAASPENQVMRATRTMVSERAQPMPGTRYKAVIGTALLGLAMIGLLAFAVDTLLARRHRRQRDSEDAEKPAAPTPRAEESVAQQPVVVESPGEVSVAEASVAEASAAETTPVANEVADAETEDAPVTRAPVRLEGSRTSTTASRGTVSRRRKNDRQVKAGPAGPVEAAGAQQRPLAG